MLHAGAGVGEERASASEQVLYTLYTIATGPVQANRRMSTKPTHPRPPMIDPNLVLFAVEAGVRLGRKINEVLVDETAQRPLLMPLGDLFGSVTEAEAMRFFSVDQPELIKPGGPCHAIKTDRPKLILFYRAMRGVEAQVVAPSTDLNARRKEIVGQLSAMDQFDHEFQAKHPARRIFGTVVEIGVDYFAAHPEALGRDSTARKIIHAFVAGLQDTDFAEGAGRQILGDLLGSALRTLGEHAALIDDDRRLTVMLGAVTGAVAEDLRLAIQEEDEVARHQLFRRIGTSLLRGTAEAFAGEIALFMPEDGSARELVQDTLSQVLQGIKGKEDIFTNETLELIVKSALRATAENTTLLTDKKSLKGLIQRTTTVLADRQWDKLFSAATAGAVLYEVLEVTRENIETLLKPGRPEEQFLAQALAAMAGSLSARLAGGGSIQDLLSRRQVVELARVVLNETARNPELLLGSADTDPKKTVLAQVIASVAKALGDEPTLLTNGEGVLQLTRVALQVTLRNVDQLIDADTLSPASNLLFRILQQIVVTLNAAEDPRQLISRSIVQEIVERVLPVVSANLEMLEAKPKLVAETIAAAIELAGGALSNRINGANLVGLIERLLTLVLWDELDLDDSQKLKEAALLVLRAA